MRIAGIRRQDGNEKGGEGGSHIVDMALAFARRYRWHSRLVPRIEMPNEFKNITEIPVVYTTDEVVQ